MDEVLRCFAPIVDPTGNPHRAQAEQRLLELATQAGTTVILIQDMWDASVALMTDGYACSRN